MTVVVTTDLLLAVKEAMYRKYHRVGFLSVFPSFLRKQLSTGLSAVYSTSEKYFHFQILSLRPGPESPLSQGAAPNDCTTVVIEGLFGITELRLHYQLEVSVAFMRVIYSF